MCLSLYSAITLFFWRARNRYEWRKRASIKKRIAILMTSLKTRVFEWSSLCFPQNKENSPCRNLETPSRSQVGSKNKQTNSISSCHSSNIKVLKVSSIHSLTLLVFIIDLLPSAMWLTFSNAKIIYADAIFKPCKIVYRVTLYQLPPCSMIFQIYWLAPNKFIPTPCSGKLLCRNTQTKPIVTFLLKNWYKNME